MALERRAPTGTVFLGGMAVGALLFGLHDAVTTNHSASRPTPEPTATPLPYSTDAASYKYRVAFVPQSPTDATIHEYTNIMPTVRQFPNVDIRKFTGKDMYCPQNQDGLDDDNTKFNLGCDNVYNSTVSFPTSDYITVESNK